MAMMTTDDADEVHYARSDARDSALLFFSAAERDAYIARYTARGLQIKPITACEAFRLTKPNPDDGSRNFFAPTLKTIVRER
jgi:hypothetical protein